MCGDISKTAARSRNMAAIKSKNTSPEIAVRKLVHALGFRYRLHADDLPGKPDLVNRAKRKAIFVHGCFWHSHGSPICRRKNTPQTRLDYWGPKLQRNAMRDMKNLSALLDLGYSVLTVWECQIKDDLYLKTQIQYFWEEK
ncbi:DNA mismatch endonuclease Vsr [Rhizobium leguminosarum]|nr:DNA mismatch endonuclease Vsr [Rhizobium leguminosarum]